jgi:hypothetical protein
VRQRHPAQPEHRVDVGPHHPVELLGRDVGEPAGLGHLVGRVVDEDVDAAELGDGRVDERLAGRLLDEVGRHQDGAAAGVLDEAGGLPRVVVLALEVGDHHVRTLAREGKGDRPADAGVATGDHRHLVEQPVVADVRLLAVVGLLAHLPGDRVLVAGLGQLLALGVGLLVHLGGVLPGLVGLSVVAHDHPSSRVRGPPPRYPARSGRCGHRPQVGSRCRRADVRCGDLSIARLAGHN